MNKGSFCTDYEDTLKEIAIILGVAAVVSFAANYLLTHNHDFAINFVQENEFLSCPEKYELYE